MESNDEFLVYFSPLPNGPLNELIIAREALIDDQLVLEKMPEQTAEIEPHVRM